MSKVPRLDKAVHLDNHLQFQALILTLDIDTDTDTDTDTDIVTDTDTDIVSELGKAPCFQLTNPLV